MGDFHGFWRFSQMVGYFTGGGHHLVTFCQVLSILEVLVAKRIAPLNSSKTHGSKSLNMLWSIMALL